MNGQLSEHPLAELIREISAKSLSGRLRVEHERVRIVVYFARGCLLYAASNLKTLRLRDYLQKSDLVSHQDLARFNEQLPDTDLVKQLSAENLLSKTAAEKIQAEQVLDVLRLALSRTEGIWEFDSRSRLNEELNINLDAVALLLEAGRRMPPKFVAARLPDPAEMITRPVTSPACNNLLPAEAFLLSRLDRPMSLRELVAVSGASEAETLVMVYSLGLAGLIERQWQNILHDLKATRPLQPSPLPPKVEKPEPAREQAEVDANDVEEFLERVRNAHTHYDVLGVSGQISTPDLKTTYYQLAKRYHPDRFRKAEGSLLTRLESAFARITQAYDTLRDENLRAGYDAKLEARKKAEQLADSAPKAATRVLQPEFVAEGAQQPVVSAAERAEMQFKEGFAAFELGQRQVALSLFASAASAVPTEPRYRAFYGHVLAANERTRRAAEGELQAAVKLDPGNAEYRVMLAELYRDLGLKLRAKGEAERALSADPNNRKARELLRALK